MIPELARPEQLAKICADVAGPNPVEKICEKFDQTMPGLDFKHVATRGNWHRLGGVVNADYQRVSNNIAQWAESESDGDLDGLILRYLDAGYFATRLAGKTHYFTAPHGESAEDFIQLEIEELQEVLERPLTERDWYPESLEEFLDPLDFPKLEPEPIGNPYYQFRRITPIARLHKDAPRENQSIANLRRFFQDWQQSSAFEGEHFCRHWILPMREYMDSDGEQRLSAKPTPVFSEQLPQLPPGDSLQGADLANAIHSYDRKLGYPFAWFFIMLSLKSENYSLAEAVLRDQMGAYDYLPARDMKVLRDWEERPYAV
jgi:hypothetical protein